MKIINKLLITAVGMLMATGTEAQTNELLAGQRKESQEVRAIPGEVIGHQGVVVNPIPHKINIDKSQTLDISRGVVLQDRKGCFGGDVSFLALAKKGPKLTIDFGGKAADKTGVEKQSGAYHLTINASGICITGRDERGAFYGLQTLRQIVESEFAKGEKIPYTEVRDYPSLEARGVVEGFYGTPWAHQARLSLIDFYGRFKLNTYIFGPKDDPYHSSPHWRQPYPENEALQIKELTERCRKNRVDFVWAIHPGQDIKWNEEDFLNLCRKFDHMYDLGVRAFAIFFDDISGEGTDPARQAELLNRIVKEFIEPKGDVAPLIFCPTDYTRSWANPTPQGSLPLFGERLHPSIRVFWTGDAVCSDVTASTLAWVNERIKRPAFSWWNYPVTDYVRHLVLQGPTYGLDTSLRQGKDLCGLVSNPMEHAEASKLALYSVADYAWNIAAYNPMDSWERALTELAGPARTAYRTFALHSGDTGTGYRRDESWETRAIDPFDYKPAEYEALKHQFTTIEQVASEMEWHCPNRPLLNELRPWLEEFSKLGGRLNQALELIKLYKEATPEAFWEAYTQALMTDEQRADYEAHMSGTLKLRPFYEDTMDALLIAFYQRLTGETPSIPRAVGSYFNLKTPPSKLMFDHNDTTYYTSGRTQKTNQWVGVDLGSVRDIYQVRLLQGRNSVDDVDYFDHALLEYSADGETWLPLGDELWKKYDIEWNGDPVTGRYVRLRKLASEKRNWIAVRTFDVNPVQADRLGFQVISDRLDNALLAFDRNPSTAHRLQGRLAFTLPTGAKEITLFSRSSTQPLVIRQYAADGRLLRITHTTAAYCPIALSPQAAKVELEGEREVMEVVM